MKPDDHRADRGSSVSATRARGRRQPFRGWVICLLLLFPLAIGPAAGKAASPPAETAHVYLLRGVLNVFSLGLDEIAARLQAKGIPATVDNYLSWSSIADDAAAEYRAGRVKTIILVGHSSGATALPDMIAKLNRLGVPVKLAIGLDSVFKTRLSTGAERYINLYIGDGPGEPVRAAAGFRGKLDNVDVQGTGVGHISIDKNELIQRRVIGEIDAVVLRPRPRARAAARN